MVGLGLGLGLSRPSSVSSDSFVPTDIANVELWLDASDASTITQSSGLVSQWDDKSGNANNLSQGTGALQPTTNSVTINGLNAIYFNDDYLERSDALGLTGNPALGVFVVARNIGAPVNVVSNTVLCVGDNSSSSVGKIIYFPSGTDGYSYRFNDGNRIFNPVNANVDEILYYQRSAGDTYGEGLFYINGVSQAETASGNPTGTPNIDNDITFVGARIPPSTATPQSLNNIYIGEIIVYNRTLSSSEANQVGTYLSDKWGVTWTDV